MSEMFSHMHLKTTTITFWSFGKYIQIFLQYINIIILFLWYVIVCVCVCVCVCVWVRVCVCLCVCVCSLFFFFFSIWLCIYIMAFLKRKLNIGIITMSVSLYPLACLYASIYDKYNKQLCCITTNTYVCTV